MLENHIIHRTRECFEHFPVITVDTKRIDKNVVSFGLFSEQRQVTIIWIGGEVGERFLCDLDKWNIDDVCRADIMLILL